MKVLHVFTLDCTPKSFFDGQFKYLTENGKHQIHLTTSSQKDEDFCERNNIVYHQIPIARRIDIKTDLLSIKELVKLIKKEQFEAVFGHTPKGALVAMIAAKIAGVKNRIYYRHGYIYTTAKGIRRFIFKNIERLTAYCSTRIVNVSPSIGGLAVKDHINPGEKQITIGKGTCGGIDTTNLFNPKLNDNNKLKNLRSLLSLSEHDFVVGFCGRICKDKGIRELIDGFKLFQKEHPEISSKLLLVGDYDERDTLPEEYKMEIGNNKSIINTGNIGKKELPYYYSLMSVFAFPSFREGFGMSVIEAGSMEVPALVSHSHGCVDSIVENQTGIYIEISQKGIIKGLEKMLDAGLRREYGINARKYIKENYDYDVLWPELLKFYKKLDS